MPQKNALESQLKKELAEKMPTKSVNKNLVVTKHDLYAYLLCLGTKTI